MKLYLSSYRIPTPEDLINLTGKKPSKVRVAIIMNAKDYLIERARNIKVSSTEEYLQKLGYINYHEIDLRKYKDIKLSNEDLKSFDMLFIAGGNTFCLMEELVNSGLNKIIKNLIDDGIVYVGESAGAVAAGKSLKGVERDDEPGFAKKQYFDGLKLVDKFILPHADNKYYSESNERSHQLYDNGELISLDDNQAYVVNGNNSYVATSRD